VTCLNPSRSSMKGGHDREGAVTTAIGQMLPDEAGPAWPAGPISTKSRSPDLRLEHVLQRLTKNRMGSRPTLPEMFHRTAPRPAPPVRLENDRYARRSKVKRCAGEGHGRGGRRRSPASEKPCEMG
jgi:hypothetical protein